MASAVARAAPPMPLLPWLLLSKYDGNITKSAYCPEDGTVVTVPRKSVVCWIIGGHDGGWLVYYLLALRIVNLFSGVEVTLAEKQRQVVRATHVHLLKIVFSQAPTSGDCILAAMTLSCGVALCRLGCTEGGWTIQGSPSGNLADITFCNGNLYALYYQGVLVKFEIGVNKDGAPMITAAYPLVVNHPSSIDYVKDYHIFDMNGKLALAFKTTWSISSEPFFKVFLLVDIHDDGSKAHYKHKWLEVTNLDDYALFLGKTFSKVVHVPADTHCNIKRNRIYYTRHGCLDKHGVIPRSTVFLATWNDSDHQIYYMEDDMKKDVAGDDLKRIRSIQYFMKGSTSRSSTNGGMWVVPPDI
ncbi:uncharacterized protein [Aegilops tauschii subsp. strangulata]|uniref:uncharacterized protein n=1 Tax=Aegilops tauschii subsp. strangulata TaxID=200361 RepID=UPI00098BC868|nr:uncharacterized protein LOC109752906 [Aegilops tauschii subsp. strangulata]